MQGRFCHRRLTKRRSKGKTSLCSVRLSWVNLLVVSRGTKTKVWWTRSRMADSRPATSPVHSAWPSRVSTELTRATTAAKYRTAWGTCHRLQLCSPWIVRLTLKLFSSPFSLVMEFSIRSDKLKPFKNPSHILLSGILSRQSVSTPHFFENRLYDTKQFLPRYTRHCLSSR